MEKIYTTLLVFMLFCGGTIFPQSYDISVKNQRVEGNDFIFEIYIVMQDAEDFYLGGSDFSLYFNNNFFLNPSVSTQNGETLEYYTSAISVLNSNIIVLNVIPPFFADQQEFETMSAKISNIEPGTKIASIILRGIIDFAGDAGLQWKEYMPNQCVIYSLENTLPWYTTEKTSSGNFISPTSTPLPVELSSFTALVNGSGISLYWQTATEVNNYGFSLERKINSSASIVNDWETIGFVQGFGNSNSPREYYFEDKNIPNGNYLYRLKMINYDGSFTFSKTLEIQVNEIPGKFALYQNYPNPFNPSTVINWQLAVSSQVSLKVYNSIGEEVSVLINDHVEAGFHSTLYIIDSTTPSGVYFYRIQAGSNVDTKKLIVVK